MEIKDGILLKVTEEDIIDGVLDIPDGVKYINSQVGFQMSTLEEINMPDSVETIFDGAFSYCDSLCSIVFSSNLKKIGTFVFFNCDKLKSFVLPDSLKEIGKQSFGSCINLKGLVIPKNVTSFDFDFNEDYLAYKHIPFVELVSSLKMPFDDILRISELGENFFVYDSLLRGNTKIDKTYRIDYKLADIMKEEMRINLIDELKKLNVDPTKYINMIEYLCNTMQINTDHNEQIENFVNYIYAKANGKEKTDDNRLIRPKNEEKDMDFIKTHNVTQFTNLPFGQRKTACRYMNNKKIINSKILNDNGRILNYKEYKTSPAIGRDKEVEALMINLLQDKKSPILVGESGTGKTSIVEEFVYRIQENDVPSFLNGQLIYELSVNSALANTKYRGELEEKVKDILEECIDNNIILFIDEIHTIFGAGKTESSNTDIASIIKFYIDRYDLKIIGTTTKDEYNKYLANDALKRRFEKINVIEPNYICMKQIIEKVINDFASKNNISLDQINNNLSSLVDHLIELTQDKHRVYDDKINNPDLVISIIDKAFAYAKFEDNSVINIKHFIKAINSCDRIYDVRKEKVISLLENFSNEKQKTYSKCIKFEPLKQ